MKTTHPIVCHQKPHCGTCGSVLLMPRKVAINPDGTVIEDKKVVDHVLMECNICSVAVRVPANVLQPKNAVHCEKTEARPWPQRVAIGST